MAMTAFKTALEDQNSEFEQVFLITVKSGTATICSALRQQLPGARFLIAILFKIVEKEKLVLQSSISGRLATNFAMPWR